MNFKTVEKGRKYTPVLMVTPAGKHKHVTFNSTGPTVEQLVAKGWKVAEGVAAPGPDA